MSGWPVYRTQPVIQSVPKTYGFAFPIFVRKAIFHFTHLGVYSDGLFDCWDSLDRNVFRRRVAQGEAAAFPTVGSPFEIGNLGSGTVWEAEWTSTPETLANRADALLLTLNPTGENMVDLHGAATVPAPGELGQYLSYSKLEICFSRAYYVDPNGREVEGRPLLVFADLNGDTFLTPWFVFADGMHQIGDEPEKRTLTEIQARFQSGTFKTTVPPNTWIHINGLGRFRSQNAQWNLSAGDLLKKARNQIALLNGEPGTDDW